MSIKYAEIIITRNLEEETWLSYFKNLIGEENIITNNDTIIISFDDGTIMDTKSVLVDKKFEFGAKSRNTNYVYPIYFNKPDKHLLFLESARLRDGNMYMNFNDIFKDDPKFRTIIKVPSTYNTIYHVCSTDRQYFAVLKNGHNHRYLLAYDDSYFDKSDVSYFIHKLFTDSFTYS
jgi:hypothetical protein